MTHPALLSEALEKAHESIKDRASIPFEQFKALTADWEVFPVQVDGEVVGAILRHASEIHACITSAGHGRWFMKPAIRILNETINTHGYATTSVRANNSIGDLFVRRLGFSFLREEGGNWLYRKDKQWVSKQLSP